MQCPKCKAEMTKVDADSVEIDRCGTCGGMWFDLRELDHMLKQGGVTAANLDTGHAQSGQAKNKQRDIDCPHCGVKLVKLSHHEQRHIQYEQCATCGGAYLDAGEFDDLRDKTAGENLRRLFPRLFGDRSSEDISG